MTERFAPRSNVVTFSSPVGLDDFDRMPDSAYLADIEMGQDSSPAPTKLNATRFNRRDPMTIPPRPWVFGRHMIRKQVSVTMAPDGVGAVTGPMLCSILAAIRRLQAPPLCT